MTLNEILIKAVQKGASDIHIKVGIPPMMRKHGKLKLLSEKFGPLTSQQIIEMANFLMDPKQQYIFQEQKGLDLAYGLSGVGRFRINIFQQRGTTRLVIRNIPDKIPSFDQLNLPAQVQVFSELERGLVLVTGATGSGKSSTLAAIINQINTTSSKHIIMLEDPTEFLVRDKKSMISQREIGIDAPSYAEALKAALRQDPDVILIGEMRDRETIEIALQAAETGHLVYSTLHTIDAQETINRVLGTFKGPQQMQIRLQLAAVLQGIISQRLLKNKDDSGFVPVIEVLRNNSRIKELITSPNRTREIVMAIEEGSSAYGMISFDQSLLQLVADEKVRYEEALKIATSPENFAIRYSGISQLDPHQKWSEKSEYKKKVQDSWQNLKEVEMEDTATITLDNGVKIKKAKS